MNDNRNFWDNLSDEEYKNQYLDFMYNENNYMKCESCPENHGYSVGCGTGSVSPCGQQHCWVECHCKENNRDS